MVQILWGKYQGMMKMERFYREVACVPFTSRQFQAQPKLIAEASVMRSNGREIHRIHSLHSPSSYQCRYMN